MGMTPQPERRGQDAAVRQGQVGAGLNWPATLTARGRNRLSPTHLRWQPPGPAGSVLHCFVLDTSASMLRANRLARAKGILAALIRTAAQRRERIALICISAGQVIERSGPTRAGAWRDDWVLPITGGGGTALTPALQHADQMLSRHRHRHPADQRLLWLLSDGRTLEQPPCPRAAQALHLIDFDDGRHALHRLARWPQRWRDGWPQRAPEIDYRLARELVQPLTEVNAARPLRQ